MDDVLKWYWHMIHSIKTIFRICLWGLFGIFLEKNIKKLDIVRHP